MSNLPERISAALPAIPEPDAEMFAEWSGEQLESWLSGESLHVAQTADHIRLAVGLALYHLRLELPDGVFGPAVVRICQASGATPVSMNRWRRDAEDHYKLPPATPRSLTKRNARVIIPPDGVPRPRTIIGQANTLTPAVLAHDCTVGALRTLRTNVERALELKGERTATAKAAESECLHPPANRLGTDCGICGASNVSNAAWGKRGKR